MLSSIFYPLFLQNIQFYWQNTHYVLFTIIIFNNKLSCSFSSIFSPTDNNIADTQRWLIKPVQAWLRSRHYTSNSFALHKITVDQQKAEKRSVAWNSRFLIILSLPEKNQMATIKLLALLENIVTSINANIMHN